MADSETQQPVDISQQVTSKTPTTKQKDPKKSLPAERSKKNREAREKQRKLFEAQKKALDEPNVKIAKYELEKAKTRVTDPSVDDSESTKNVLTTTQWLSVISIFVSMLGIYYRREEIKSFLNKKPPQNPPPSPVDAAPTPPPVNIAPKRKGIICPMD